MAAITINSLMTRNNEETEGYLSSIEIQTE